MRNDYEHAIGHFENSVRLPIKNFKEIPDVISTLQEKVADKKIVSVCTGGVRCEKATQYLLQEGFKDVYQLEGGMVRYLEKYPGKKFKGKLYVFDGRITVSYDKPEEHTVVGVCHVCEEPCEDYYNCEYPLCHAHFICCKNCSEDGVFCSEACRKSSLRALQHKE